CWRSTTLSKSRPGPPPSELQVPEPFPVFPTSPFTVQLMEGLDPGNHQPWHPSSPGPSPLSARILSDNFYCVSQDPEPTTLQTRRRMHATSFCLRPRQAERLSLHLRVAPAQPHPNLPA